MRLRTPLGVLVVEAHAHKLPPKVWGCERGHKLQRLADGCRACGGNLYTGDLLMRKRSEYEDNIRRMVRLQMEQGGDWRDGSPGW
jgi:hypothetical protein